MIASIGYIQNTIHCIQRQPHGQIWGRASSHPAEVKSQLHTRASHFQQPFETLYSLKKKLQLLLSVKPCKNSFQHGNQLPFSHQMSQKTTVPRYFLLGLLCSWASELRCHCSAITESRFASSCNGLLGRFKRFPEEILHGKPQHTDERNPANRYGAFPTIYSVLYIPGACLGFLPSTVISPPKVGYVGYAASTTPRIQQTSVDIQTANHVIQRILGGTFKEMVFLPTNNGKRLL